jgi:hypothetical protein
MGIVERRAVIVFILVIGITELHVVEAAGEPPAARISVGLDVGERGELAWRRSPRWGRWWQH